MLACDRRHGIELVVCHHRACRVVGVDHDEGAQPARARLFGETLHVELPSAVKLEPVVLERNRVEVGKVFDQRVARARRQHNIARVAQQLEQQRVSLARAGRQDDPVRGYRDATTREVVRYRLPCREQPERLRVVAQRQVPGHRRKHTWRVRQADTSGVGHGEIDNRQAVGATPFDCHGEPVTARRLPQTRGEHRPIQLNSTCSRWTGACTFHFSCDSNVAFNASIGPGSPCTR